MCEEMKRLTVVIGVLAFASAVMGCSMLYQTWRSVILERQVRALLQLPQPQRARNTSETAFSPVPLAAHGEVAEQRRFAPHLARTAPLHGEAENQLVFQTGVGTLRSARYWLVNPCLTPNVK